MSEPVQRISGAGVGSHLVPLQWVVEHTQGPILELGAGDYSTRYLAGTGRDLITVESDPKWRDRIARYRPPNVVTEIPTEGHFGLVFIDHEPEPVRRPALDGLNGRFDVAVVHDVWLPTDPLQRYPPLWSNILEAYPDAWWYYPHPTPEAKGPPTMVTGGPKPDTLPGGHIL